MGCKSENPVMCILQLSEKGGIMLNLYLRDIVVHVSLVSLVVAVGVHHKSLSNDDLLHQLSPFVLFKVTCRLSML